MKVRQSSKDINLLSLLFLFPNNYNVIKQEFNHFRFCLIIVRENFGWEMDVVTGMHRRHQKVHSNFLWNSKWVDLAFSWGVEVKLLLPYVFFPLVCERYGMGNDWRENGNPQEFHYKLITCWTRTARREARVALNFFLSQPADHLFKPQSHRGGTRKSRIVSLTTK